MEYSNSTVTVQKNALGSTLKTKLLGGIKKEPEVNILSFEYYDVIGVCHKISPPSMNRFR
jgi:hypothetical protein